MYSSESFFGMGGGEEGGEDSLNERDHWPQWGVENSIFMLEKQKVKQRKQLFSSKPTLFFSGV